MCGLLSVINKQISESDFDRALSTIHHRGPDDRGMFQENNINLGHTRLSIIDLNHGHQPLLSDDEQLVLTCNGELYDFERIRSELEAKGHKFSTKSDSEIIIYLYKEYGMDMFEHLRGEFAFVLYDKAKQKIIACRDRFGIKPLFYSKLDNGIIFGSEVKAIFATGMVKAELDHEQIRNYFSYFNRGVFFRNVDMLTPATYMEYDVASNSMEIKKYWHLDLPNYQKLDTEKTFEQLKQEVRDKFDEAVKLRLRADVPVGVFLSGGIDSSAVIGSIAAQRKDTIKAFSISFTEDDKFNESSLSRKMADHVNAEYHEIKATKQRLLDNFEAMLWHTEIPTHNLHGVGKFLLSKLAREHVTVCLTGEGGDEVFLGYDYFKLDETGTPKSFGNVSGQVFKNRKKRRGNFLERFKKVKEYIGIQPMTEIVANASSTNIQFIQWLFKSRDELAKNPALKQLKESIDREAVEGLDSIAELQYFSIRHIMAPYILNMLGDRQEMSHSLEGRTPLLDHHLFEFARSIPLKYKIKDNNDEKHILKEATRDRVIKEIYERHKWPYFAPTIPVAKGDNPTMDRMIDKYLSADMINEAGVFEHARVKRLMRWYMPAAKWFSPKTYHRLNSLMTTILSVQILHYHFCRNR